MIKTIRKIPLWVRIIIILLLIPLVLALFSLTQIYPAKPSAYEALKSDESVEVLAMDRMQYVLEPVGSRTPSLGYFFDGPVTDKLIVFYAGAEVEPEAYAPLCHAIAAEDADVFLMRSPLYLAIFKIGNADLVFHHQDQLESGMGRNNSYTREYVAGHSMGAAVAGMYAAKHLDDLDGIIMLAGYPTKDLHAEHFTMLSVYGAEDFGLESLQKNPELRPDDYTEVVIQGGNHAWFGDYGEQRGDGTATISPEEQRAQTVEAIRNYLHK